MDCIKDNILRRCHPGLEVIARVMPAKYLVRCKRCGYEIARTAQNLHRSCGQCTGAAGYSIEQLQQRCHKDIEYVRFIGESQHLVRCRTCFHEMTRTANHLDNQCMFCRADWNTPKISDEELIARCHKDIEFVQRTENCMVTVRCLICNEIKTRKPESLGQCCQCHTICYESKSEIELNTWIQSLGVDTRKLKTHNREFDIFVSDLNLCIEYNGLYWHSEQVLSKKSISNPKNYHFEKMQLANSLGYRLITIFEDEWLTRKAQVKGFLRSVLGKNEIILGARKCQLMEVSNSDTKIFMDTYHIQGAMRNLINFGLYYKDELIGVISGGRHHRQGHERELVLNRMCFKDNVTVSGGATKLFARLTEWATAKGYSKIVSWSDNRYSEGAIYQTMGFYLAEDLKFDYSYVTKQNTRISKQSQKKTPAERLTGLTEYVLAQQKGLDRIWDCGKKRWEYSLED